MCTTERPTAVREAAAIGEADVGMQLDDGGATSGVRRASESDDAGSCVESGVGEQCSAERRGWC